MPELSNERVSEKYVADMLAHPARRTLIGERELAALLTEIQQRRAYVVTPDWSSSKEREAAKAGEDAAFAYSKTGGGPIGVFLEGLRAYRAALSVVSHETGDGETQGGLPWEFDVEAYVDGYEFRGDGGDYTPNDQDRAMLVDAIAGVIGELSATPAPTDETQGVKRDDEGRLPTREEAARAAAVLIRCNGHDLDVWTDGEWPSNTDFLDTLVHNHDQ